jgi:hypothetical protein
MRVAHELIELVYELGQRRVVGARMDDDRDRLILLVDAPDAPSNAVGMEPVYRTRIEGGDRWDVVMTDPGWIFQ